MKYREGIVAAIIQAAGGELVSRIRLQKTVYLLDRLGLGTGFDYEYYHYGPYSRDLDNATADAEAFDLVKEDYGRRVSDGARYSIFRLKIGAKVDADFSGQLSPHTVSELAQRFAKTNVTVLELAATVDWLVNEEKIVDWRQEVTKRKSAKVCHGRLERAVELLKDLGLAPPAATAA